MSHFHLFAYGTLRSGDKASVLLRQCERIGPAEVSGILYDIEGSYPAAILYGETPIHGEVWKCPAHLLLRLDEYEGTAAGLFRRVATEARRPDGTTVSCWVYAAGPALSRKLQPEAQIPGGRYTGV